MNYLLLCDIFCDLSYCFLISIFDFAIVSAYAALNVPMCLFHFENQIGFLSFVVFVVCDLCSSMYNAFDTLKLFTART